MKKVLLLLIAFAVVMAQTKEISTPYRRSNIFTAPTDRDEFIKNDIPRSYCGRNLSAVMKFICANPETRKILEDMAAGKETKGNIIQTCCKNECHLTALIKFCPHIDVK